MKRLRQILKPCPKCGERRVKVTYVEGRPMDFYYSGELRGMPLCRPDCPQGEHLNIVCLICDYRWWLPCVKEKENGK